MTLSIAMGQVSYKNFKEMNLIVIQKWKSTPNSGRWDILINKMGKNKKLYAVHFLIKIWQRLIKFDLKMSSKQEEGSLTSVSYAGASFHA